MNEWKVMHNPAAGKYQYQIFRFREDKRPDEPMHSGNIEVARGIYETREKAQAAADKMNRRSAQMTELKQCPFCGGDAEIYESEAFNLKTEEQENGVKYFVGCTKCTALTCGSLKRQAIEAWNRRTGRG